MMSLVASALRRLELVGAMYLGSVITHMLRRTALTGGCYPTGEKRPIL